MRIGMFADMYKPHISGVTNYISLYKRRFEDLGHEVFVFTYGNESYHDDEANVVRSPAIAWGHTGWQAGLRLSQEARALIPTMDIAHTHHPFLSGRVALRECRPANIPVIFTNHTRYDLYSDAYARFAPRVMRMAFLRSYLHDFASEVDMVLAPSPGIRKWLGDFGITESAVLHSNAVDTLPFTQPTDPRTPTDFGWSDDSIIFCYLGRIGPEKNLDMLVDSFLILAAEEPRARLLLLGDGPGRGAAQEKLWANGLTDRVHFAGRTSYDEVPDLLAVADVFVTASVSEVHPLVVMEAMAAGLPAVGVVSPGVGDIIRNGETGFLTTESASEFAARMLDLARDRGLRERMSATARAVSAEYDIRPMADLLLERYEGLIAARGEA